MELRHLRTFKTVAILNSFNRAADVLYYAQSTISEHIRSLEDDLKVLLFDRMGRRIRLTEAGEKLMGYAQKILDIEEELRVEVSGQKEPQGTLSIRIPVTISTYYITPIIHAFHKRYPRIGLDFMSCSYYSLQQELQSGMLNLAFIILDAFEEAKLNTEVLCKIPLVLVANPDSKLTSKSSLSVGDLKGETIFIAKNDCSYRLMFEKILTQNKVNPQIIIELNSIESIKKCIIEGMGVSLLPLVAVAEELHKGLLAELSLLDTIRNPDLLMIWNEVKKISPILNEFINTTREHFSSI
jgi:DNA-binding transcriptional LysR family regulator